MDESLNKNENNNNKFLGKKRELPEIKLDSLSENEKPGNKEEILMEDIDELDKNTCTICRKKGDFLKFENLNDILKYSKEEKIDISQNSELQENKNIIFNNSKILCQECLKNIITDKDKFNKFFNKSIEIISEYSDDNDDDNAEIKIYEEEPIQLNEEDSNKNKNEQNKEEDTDNIILSNSQEENKNNQINILENQINNDEIKFKMDIQSPNNKEINNKLNSNIINNIQNITNDELNNEINKNKVDNEDINNKQNEKRNNDNEKNKIQANNNLNQIMNMNYNSDNGSNTEQNLQNLVFFNNYLSSINMSNQTNEQQTNNIQTDKNNNQNNNDNNNMNPSSIQDQQALYIKIAFLQYLNYCQIYNTGLIQNQLSPMDIMNLNALYAYIINNNNINRNQNGNNTINNNPQNNNEIKNNNTNNNIINKDIFEEKNEINKFDVGGLNKNIENNNMNTKLEVNQNNNILNERKKLTEIDRCINELKNQILNVKNCLKYEDLYYNVISDLGNKFQTEIVEIKNFKDKLTQLNINTLNFIKTSYQHNPSL